MQKSQHQKAALSVAIQGYPGAFHQIAAEHYYASRQVKVIPAHSFSELVAIAEDEQQADAAIMAIENSLAGSILQNYQLIQNSSLQIVGEVYIRIRQNLLALPGISLADIREVHSHPMAIHQCRPFFRDHPHIRLIETADTALSAHLVSQNNWRHIGAIASTLAADLYGLQVLAPAIEHHHENYTRFLILQKKEKVQEDANSDKVSVSFQIPHETGSLHTILGLLAGQGANLTKIQSVPIIGSQWQYMFFVDFLLSSAVAFNHTIAVLKAATQSLNILGKYQKGSYHEY